MVVVVLRVKEKSASSREELRGLGGHIRTGKCKDNGGELDRGEKSG